MRWTNNLEFFVNQANTIRAQFKDKASTAVNKVDTKTPEKDVADAMDRFNEHAENFRKVHEKLKDLHGLGKHGLDFDPIKFKEIPGLGKFWTETSIEEVLKRKPGEEVTKEIFLGLVEGMKQITAFTDALPKLAEIKPELKNDIIDSNGNLDLKTTDGYRLMSHVKKKHSLDDVGIDLNLDGCREQAISLSTPDKSIWAKYSQRAGPPIRSGESSPGGWKLGSQIGTIALTDVGNYKPEQGGTVLLEHGKRVDGSNAAKVWVKGMPERLLQDEKIVGKIANALYGKNPLFTRAA